jgi:tRNA threonylcarbamoyladenosine biosynthesis protein TsaE
VLAVRAGGAKAAEYRVHVNSNETLVALFAGGASQEFSLEALTAWGEAVGAALPPNAVVTLHGDLGAGKTTLARALCVGAGVHNVHAVTSPTFAIVHQYAARGGMIVHADLYRLKNGDDLDAIGWEELMSIAVLTLVEWPERVTRGWPSGTIAIAMHGSGENCRRITVSRR